MKNADYFLKEGKYTKRDNLIKRELKKIIKIKERENIWGKISFYIEHNLKYNKSKGQNFRKRTASEIIKSGFSTGCSDNGIVFCIFARETGIPTKYIETFDKENIKKKPKLVAGHIFIEIFIDNKWRTYEPKNGFLRGKGFCLNNRKYIKIGEGLDFSSLRTPNGKKISLDTFPKIKKLRDSF